MNTIGKCAVLLLVSTSAWSASLSDFSQKDAATGLRQALTQGATQAVSTLGKPDGFLGNPQVKIPLPPRLAKAEKMLRLAGMGSQADDLVTAMNRAAEAAVPEAKPLLLNAVKSMSVQDAKDILTGGDDSVTRFFQAKTADSLTRKFLPVVQKYTAGVGLAQSYNQLAGKGLQLGLIKPEDASIDSYVARSALDGVYKMIAQEEKAIRADPMKAAGAMAKKIFGTLDQSP
jgi:hypothetical protein